MARLAVGPVDPGDNGIVIGAAVVLAGAIIGRVRPKLLDDDRITRGHGHAHVGIPSAGVHLIGGVGIKMRSVNNPVSGSRVGQVVGRNPRQVVGPSNPAGENDIVGACAADGRQEGLQTNAIETGSPRRSTALPSRPTCGIGFIEKVEDDGRIVRVSGGHRGPKGHGILVRHGLLAGGGAPTRAARRSRSGSRGSGPMQVQVHIAVVIGTIGDDLVDQVPVISLVGALGAEPKILVQGNANDVAFPAAYRDGDSGHGVARGLASRVVFSAGVIHSVEPDGATAGGRDNLIT